MTHGKTLAEIPGPGPSELTLDTKGDTMEGQSMTTDNVLDGLKYATSTYLKRLIERATAILKQRGDLTRKLPGE